MKFILAIITLITLYLLTASSKKVIGISNQLHEDYVCVINEKEDDHLISYNQRILHHIDTNAADTITSISFSCMKALDDKNSEVKEGIIQLNNSNNNNDDDDDDDEEDIFITESHIISTSLYKQITDNSINSILDAIRNRGNKSSSNNNE